MGMGVGQRTGVCDLSLTRFVVLQRDIQTLGGGVFLASSRYCRVDKPHPRGGVHGGHSSGTFHARSARVAGYAKPFSSLPAVGSIS